MVPRTNSDHLLYPIYLEIARTTRFSISMVNLYPICPRIQVEVAVSRLLIGVSNDFLYLLPSGLMGSTSDKPEERPHPFSAGVITEDVPSVWLLADTSPDTHAEERDHVQSMRPFPLMRHDSAGRSSSEYSKLRPRQARHSVPSLPLPPANFGTNSSLRSGTP
jgi:hypothetical protein